MLFWVKARTLRGLIALVAVLGLAWALGVLLGVSLEARLGRREILGAALGLAVIGASDGLVHGSLLVLARRTRYRQKYRALAFYFEDQNASGAFAGSLVAAAEELLFRGVLFAALAHGAGLGNLGALVATSILFGLAHMIPRAELAGFAVWAAWEGALLGAIRIATGSVAAAALAHFAHDLVGFAIFAHERRNEV